MTGGVGRAVMAGVTAGAAAGVSLCRAPVGGCWAPRIPQLEPWPSLLEPGQSSLPGVLIVADQLVSSLRPVSTHQLQVSLHICRPQGVVLWAISECYSGEELLSSSGPLYASS